MSTASIAPTNVRRLVESAVMLAIANVLSVLSFQGPWALGGSITVCSMLPLVIIAWRWGTKWGLLTAFVHGLLQMLMGFANVQYGRSPLEMLLIAFLDYLLAYAVIGLAALFRGKTKKELSAILLGIVVAFLMRYACHFLSGWLIWEALWPNELGWASTLWSLAYNGSYMVPEILITAIVAAASYLPLKTLWGRQ